MAYTPTDWVDNVTLVDAARMNKLEAGVANAVEKPAGIADGEAAVWDAGTSTWVPSSQGEILKLAAAGVQFGSDTILYRDGPTGLLTNKGFGAVGQLWTSGCIWTERALATELALDIYVTGDTHDRLRFQADGLMAWGPGNAPSDVVLYRFGPDMLATPDDLILNGGTLRSIAPGARQLLTSARDGDPSYRFRIDDTGYISWGPGNAAEDVALYRSAVDRLYVGASTVDLKGSLAFPGEIFSAAGTVFMGASGFQWGPGDWSRDVNLYRIAANRLRTDGDFDVTNGLVVDLGGTGAKLYFGSGADVNLYRAGPDTLKTDDSLEVGGTLKVGGVLVTPGGGGADLSYDGDWVAGTYQDGDVVVKDGIAYLCVGGPTTEAPSLAPWGNAGQSLVGDELAYAEITASVAVTATAEATPNTIITAPPVTLDGATPVVVEFFSPSAIPHNTTAGWLRLMLFEDGVNKGWLGDVLTSGPGVSWVPVSLQRRITPSAGAHTYSIRAWASGPSTVNAGVGGSSGVDVPAFIRVRRVTPSPPQLPVTPLTPPTYGISLPASPTDGQEAVLVDSLTNPKFQWRFRYNAGSSSAYKWEFIGGSPLKHEIALKESRSAASYGNLATVGPTVTAPRAGEYLLEYGSGQMEFATNSIGWMSPSFGGSTPSDTDAAVGRSFGAAGGSAQEGHLRKTFTLTAGQVVTMQYRCFDTNMVQWGPNRILTMLPQRVA